MTPEEKEAQEETPQAEQVRPAEPAKATAEEEPARKKPEAEADRPERARAEADRPERARADSGEHRRRRFGRRKVCAFCVDHVRIIDYKDPAKLRRYLSDRGRIEPRRKTGTCTKHQRWLSVALKRARHLALLPYTPEHIRTTGMFAPRR